MSKVFRFAGVSRQEGVMKARFSNRDSYSAVLAKEGHTDIAILELPQALTQEEAVAHLKATEFSKDPEVMGALEARIARKPSVEKHKEKDSTPAAAETSEVVKMLTSGWLMAPAGDAAIQADVQAAADEALDADLIAAGFDPQADTAQDSEALSEQEQALITEEAFG